MQSAVVGAGVGTGVGIAVMVGEDVGANGPVATETFKLEKPNDSLEQSPTVSEKLYPVLHSLVS